MAAAAAGAVVVDPRPWLTGGLLDVFARYPHIGPVLLAVGYRKDQLDDLARTIDPRGRRVRHRRDPADLTALLKVAKPAIGARYDCAETGTPTLSGLADAFLDRLTQAPMTT